MRKSHRKCRAEGGNISASELSRGNANGVRNGLSSKALALGMPSGQTRARGGMVNDGFGRLLAARKRNEALATPGFSEGGLIHKRMKSLYKALHSHFENEPQMKKLRVKSAEVYEGEPHRESKSEMRKASGGPMWIKGAIKHPGALHKSLGIPAGKKIPLKTLKKAEHSSSPLMRKRAHLAETLRKFHK